MVGNLLQMQKNEVLMKSINARMARNSAIASNIANVTTPGYQRKEVRFEESLSNAISGSSLKGTKTSSKHISFGTGDLSEATYEVVRPIDATQPSGVNNVDIDKEMADLTENQIGFKYSIKMLSQSYKTLNAAISGRTIQ